MLRFNISSSSVKFKFKGQKLHKDDWKLKSAIETMDISFGNLTYGSGDIEIKWEYTLITIPFEVPYADIIDQRLEVQLNTLASDYATTATIYYQKNNDPNKAMQYLNLCTNAREAGLPFDEWLSNIKDKDLGLPWATLMKSKIYADRKDYKNAIHQANISIKIAEVVVSKYYLKENNTNLKKWKGM